VLCHTKWVSSPDADKAKSLEERRKLLDNAILYGCRCSLHEGMEIVDGKTKHYPCKHGPISVTMWLPNFKTPGCYSTLGLVENLSKLVALEKAKGLMDNHPA